MTAILLAVLLALQTVAGAAFSVTKAKWAWADGTVVVVYAGAAADEGGVRRAFAAIDNAARSVRFEWRSQPGAGCDAVPERAGIVVCNTRGGNLLGWARFDVDGEHIVGGTVALRPTLEGKVLVEVALHEGLHAMGLNHEGKRKKNGKPVSVMHPTEITGYTKPTRDDKRGLAALGYR